MSWSITDSNVLEDRILELKLRIATHIGIREGMTVVDLGCGQGGFTASVARLVGERGKVFAVDVADEHVGELMEHLDRYGVRNRVAFFQADGTNLEHVISESIADMVVSFRLLEELKSPCYMPNVIGQMFRAAKNSGRICLTEMSSVARNKAEEVYIRLHKESGDCFFKNEEILQTMRQRGLKDVRVSEFDTDIWFSPDLARQDLSHAQVWSDSNVERSLGSMIDAHGMKYPKLLIFSGQKPFKRKARIQ